MKLTPGRRAPAGLGRFQFPQPGAAQAFGPVAPIKQRKRKSVRERQNEQEERKRKSERETENEQ